MFVKLTLAIFWAPGILSVPSLCGLLVSEKSAFFHLVGFFFYILYTVKKLCSGLFEHKTALQNSPFVSVVRRSFFFLIVTITRRVPVCSIVAVYTASKNRLKYQKSPLRCAGVHL